MSTPHKYLSPGHPFPPAPHPTPSSAPAYNLTKSKLQKPPIYNPYDKFTQPEFDTWIDGITGALRRALGEHDILPRSTLSFGQSGRTITSSAGVTGEGEANEEVEDSFAQFKARRVVGKGKARDPREGPGLGGRDQPIEIGSDSDEERVIEDLHDEEDEEEQSSDDEEAEDGEYPWQASDEFTPLDSQYEGNDAEGEEEEGDIEEVRRESPDVVEAISVEEEIKDQDGSDLSIELIEDDDSEDQYSDEDGGTYQLIGQPSHHISGNMRYSPAEEANEIEQPEVGDTAFPPYNPSHIHAQQPISIPDPWRGPKTYAEDFYSGGDVRGNHLTADHLADDDIEMFLTPGIVTPLEVEAGAEMHHDEVMVMKLHDDQETVGVGLNEDDRGEEENERDEENEDSLPASSPLPSSPPEMDQPHQDSNQLEDVFEVDDLYDNMEVGFSDQIQDETGHQNDEKDGGHPPAPTHIITPGIRGISRDKEGQDWKADMEQMQSTPEIGENMEDEDNGAGIVPLGTSDLDIVVAGRDDEQENEAGKEHVDVNDAGDDKSIHGPPAEPPAAQVLDSVVSPETTITAAELKMTNPDETSMTVSGIPIDPVLLNPDPSEYEHQPDAEGNKRQQQDDLGLIASLPAEYELSFEPLPAGQQEITDMPAPPVQDESEPAAFELEETTVVVDVRDTYTVVEPQMGDTDATIVFDGDVVSVVDDWLGAVVGDYEIEEPLTEGRLTEEPGDHAMNFRAVSVVGDVVDAPADNSSSVGIDDKLMQDIQKTMDVTVSDIVACDPFETAVSDRRTPVDTKLDHPTANGPEIAISVGEFEDPSEANAIDDVTSAHKIDDHSCPEHPYTIPLQEGIPMPISADPTVPDPTSRPSTPRQPLILSMPGTPTFLLSPAGTPGSGRPTPVSVPVPASILKALQLQQSQPRMSMSGLFTPAAASASGPGSPEGPQQTDNDGAVLPRREEEENHSQTEEPTPTVLMDTPISQPNFELPPRTVTSAKVSNHVPPPARENVMSGEEAHGGSQVEGPEHAYDVFTVDSYSPVTDPEAFKESAPKLKPPPSYKSPTISYPMRVEMTRQPTDPVLYSDPYPYCLSTPGSGFLDEDQDESSEDENDLDNSVSSTSSSRDNELENKDGKAYIIGNSDNHVSDAPEHPTARFSDSGISKEPSTKIDTSDVDIRQDHTAERDTEGVRGEDADAEGDMDPDFVKSSFSFREALIRQLAIIAMDESANDDNDEEYSSDESWFPDLSEDDSKSPNAWNGVSSVSHADPFSISSEVATTPQSKDASSLIIANAEETLPIKDSGVAQSAAKPDPVRPSKRKRNPVVHFPSRLTRSMSSKGQGTHNVPPRLNDKSKEKDSVKHANIDFQNPTTTDQMDENFDGSQSSSGASTASRMLRPGSRDTSRASSIASSAASDSSSKTQPSPTGQKNHRESNQKDVLPPPLLHTHLHTHTIPHHHHRSPPSTVQQHLQRHIQRVPSFTRPHDAVTVEPSTSSQPSPAQRAAPVSSSPITRSNCRYHKISLPREEGGPRVCFLVPGCSMGDRELMTTEEIVDHGDATIEDGARMVQDLASLDFTSELIGILRQLVGVDLLREQEVYYLPQPGEELLRKSRKFPSDKSPLSRLYSRDSAIAAEPGSPVRSSIGSAHSQTSRAPVSTAASTSTSASILRKGKSSGRGSFSTVSHAESESSEEDDGPGSKRSKPSPAKDNGTLGKMTSLTQPQLRLTTRRSKRLDKDASAYQPETEVEEDSADEKLRIPRTRRKRIKRGVKRVRTADGTGGDEDTELQKTKRQKRRASRSG